jgi:hypothetical protein
MASIDPLLPAADICVTELFGQGRSHGNAWRGVVYRCYESQRKHFPSHIAVHTDVNFPHEQIRCSQCKRDAGRTIPQFVTVITKSRHWAPY